MDICLGKKLSLVEIKFPKKSRISYLTRLLKRVREIVTNKKEGMTMKVLVLNGSTREDEVSNLTCSILKEELTKKDHQIELINLYDIPIANCLGCFGCWIKTPGECVIEDEGRYIAKAMVQSDLFVTITPITFGGYSYELKKTMDRLLPNILPFFTKIKGEVHHKPRYKKYPDYLSIGITSDCFEPKAETFKTLVTRNSINLHSRKHLTGILSKTQSHEEIEPEIVKLLKEMGV